MVWRQSRERSNEWFHLAPPLGSRRRRRRQRPPPPATATCATAAALILLLSTPSAFAAAKRGWGLWSREMPSTPPTGNFGGADLELRAPHLHGDVGMSTTAQGGEDKGAAAIAVGLDARIATTTTTTTTTMATFLSVFRSLVAPRLLRVFWIGSQLVVSYYLAKGVCSAFKEAWDEINDELSSSEGGSAGVAEEHDRPYLGREGAVDALSDAAARAARSGMKRDGGSVADRDPEKDKGVDGLGDRSGVHPSAIPAAVRDLAARLHAAGLPFASDVEGGDGGGTATATVYPHTVEHVLRSLTRTEGQVLSQTLLSPFDDSNSSHRASCGDEDGKEGRQQQRIVQAWDDIGGLANVKESLLDLAFPLLMASQRGRRPQTNQIAAADDDYGGLLSNPPGALLYGPPGCGKTMLVRALAQTAQARFLCVAPSTLLRKYVGETNLHVRALFSVARKVAPCIIFVDELDGLFRERGGVGRGHDEHDVGRDLKTEFMQLWDGIRNEPGEGGSSAVLVIGATNRPFDVDAAFLRRMPRSLFVGLPDRNARVEVLRSMLRRVPLAPGNFDVEQVADATGGYAPSDLREVLRTAALVPLREARAEAIRRMEDRERRRQGRREVEDNGVGGKEDSSDADRGSDDFVGRMPPIRPLTTDDVLQAVTRVAPTQYSSEYRAALVEYARAGRSGGDRSGGGWSASQAEPTGHHAAPHRGPTPNPGALGGAGAGDIAGDAFFYTDSGTFYGGGDKDGHNSGCWSDSDTLSDGDTDDVTTSYDDDDL